MLNYTTLVDALQAKIENLLIDPAANQEALRTLLQTASTDRFAVEFTLKRLPQLRICNGRCGQHFFDYQIHSLLQCHHTVCHSCLIDHVLSSLRNAPNAAPQCPRCMQLNHLNNISTLTPSEVQFAVDMAAAQGRLQLSTDQPSSKTCNTFTGCPFFGQLAPADQILTCRCGKELCWVCCGKFIASEIKKQFKRLRKNPARWRGQCMNYTCPLQTTACDLQLTDLRGLLTCLPSKYAAAVDYIDACPAYFLRQVGVEFRQCMQCQQFAECAVADLGCCYRCANN